MMFFPVPINDCYSCGQKYIASTCPHCEIAALRAQLAAAQADKLEAMQRVIEAAAGMCDEVVRAVGSSPMSSIYSALHEYKRGILTLDLDALAEGEK